MVESYLANSTPSFRNCQSDHLHTFIRTRVAFLGFRHHIDDQQIDMDTALR